VKALLDPEVTLTLPDGEIVPPVPAEAEMVYVVELLATKEAAMVLFAVILEKV
jgi:23S rRNA A1618 N6-methylase RlmF